MIGKNGNKVTSSQSPNSILLVDSSSIISEIKKIYDDSFALIVSFDYNSHKKLEQNHIPHKRSEEFFPFALWAVTLLFLGFILQVTYLKQIP